MDEYVKELKEKIGRTYEVANRARAMGKDLDVNVESLPAGDLAARVEGLVGPKGIENTIRKLGRDNIQKIIDEVSGDMRELPDEEKKKMIEQALRTALAIITEGVVAAPIEGVSKVDIKNNADGSQCLAVYFSGPIRSAGGTAQGLAVLIGEYLRRKANLQEYRPTNDEMERYVEEIKIYNSRVSRLQYLPSDDDIRAIVKNANVCVDGEPTEKREVSIHRDLKGVETNRIRGGACLVIAEGMAQKAPKIMKHATAMGLDWSWLGTVGKGKAEAKEEDASGDVKPLSGFMSEVVGGRPIFASPSAKGAFRLRYGRNRASGIAAKSIHPATMLLLDEFIATGTQVKVERPGKGCIITNCDSIEGPIVRLSNGSVIRVDDVETARKVKNELDEVLFLGDILVSYGDFLQTNTRLLPAGYCEEWWALEVRKISENIPLETPDVEDAMRIAKEFDAPLHPRYTYHWEDVGISDVEEMVMWLSTGAVDKKLNALVVKNNEDGGKKTLEFLGVPHEVDKEDVIIKEYLPLLYPLKAHDGVRFTREDFTSSIAEFKGKQEVKSETAFSYVADFSPVKIRRKSGTYIGARMGRPEKARERKMKPAVHSLFPIGGCGGKERLINVAAERNSVEVDVAIYECPECKTVSMYPRCENCGEAAIMKRSCPFCGIITTRETCPKCQKHTQFYQKREIKLRDLWRKAIGNVGAVKGVKGVKGMISQYKAPEPLEKGILRARNDVYVFKDGTIRFDATDAPLTHFKAKEIGTGIEKLRELGYSRDYLGNDLVDEDQVVELKVQDVILAESGGDYLRRVARFVDNLLTQFYNTDPFYGVEGRGDLVGHLVVGLAPHTSAGIIGRIIGFTKANVCFAHPYWHAAKRRNADGDEDAIILALEGLINFSRKYLPEKRGGKMDAPLVITTILDPKEVDDEAHKVEIVDHYPLEFYEKTWGRVNPSEVDIATVSSILDGDACSGLLFTHPTGDVTGPVLTSRYIRLDKMDEKVEAQLRVAEKSRAIDEREVAELVINSHFLRDTYGNLRSFSRQKFRCVSCNASYRRVPLRGKCIRCGGKLLLTVSAGNVTKYLGISIHLSEKYGASDYLKQRLKLLKREISSLFTNDLSKQMGLSDFM